MVETNKEKYLRILLIIFFVSLTAGAFFYRYKEPAIENKSINPQAVVIKQSTGLNENPIVILYHYEDKKHILAKYEVERNHNFHFNTLEAIELKQEAESILKDSKSGVWIKAANKWSYFNEWLELEEREKKDELISTTLPFEEVNADFGKKLLIHNREIIIEPNEMVTEVHSLSRDGTIFMLVTRNGVKIAGNDIK